MTGLPPLEQCSVQDLILLWPKALPKSLRLPVLSGHSTPRLTMKEDRIYTFMVIIFDWQFDWTKENTSTSEVQFWLCLRIFPDRFPKDGRLRSSWWTGGHDSMMREGESQMSTCLHLSLHLHLPKCVQVARCSYCHARCTVLPYRETKQNQSVQQIKEEKDNLC